MNEVPELHGATEPVPRQTVDAVLSVAELFEKMRTGTEFTIDQILEMLSFKDDLNEHFAIHMNGYTYLVLKESIKAYFTDNPKPKRRISKEEENTILKSQLKAMEQELLKLRGIQDSPKRRAISDPGAGDLVETEPLDLDEKVKEDVHDALADELRASAPEAEPARRGRPRKV